LDKKIIHHDTMKGQSFTQIWNSALCEHKHSTLCYAMSSRKVHLAGVQPTFDNGKPEQHFWGFYSAALCHCKGNVEAMATSFCVFLLTITHQAQNWYYKDCSMSKVPWVIIIAVRDENSESRYSY
jgi:hypothetical protein